MYKVIIFIFGFCFFSCKSQTKPLKEKDTDYKTLSEDVLKIQEIYYQKWVAGIQEGGHGITIYIDLKEPLENKLELEKVQLKTAETTTINKVDELHYIAQINIPTKDLKLDENPKKEYGNETPTNNNLKEGQVKLFFTKNGSNYFKLIENVKEKPMIAYPSMNKEKN